jgi:hypothetical protein
VKTREVNGDVGNMFVFVVATVVSMFSPSFFLRDISEQWPICSKALLQYQAKSPDSSLCRCCQSITNRLVGNKLAGARIEVSRVRSSYEIESCVARLGNEIRSFKDGLMTC